jgi:hypothetical protein
MAGRTIEHDSVGILSAFPRVAGSILGSQHADGPERLAARRARETRRQMKRVVKTHSPGILRLEWCEVGMIEIESSNPRSALEPRQLRSIRLAMVQEIRMA